MGKKLNNDPLLDKQVLKLYRLQWMLRWILVVILWLTIIPWGLWQFRETISLCTEYCTWANIRLGIEFNLIAGFAVSFVVAFTTSVLVGQSYDILRGGLSPQKKYYLTQKVKRIRKQGDKNILWRWLKNP